MRKNDSSPLPRLKVSRSALQEKHTAIRTQADRRLNAEAGLIAAARNLIARHGWAGTTLAQVGEQAGYSRGLAAHYFGNKSGLLRAITQQINNSLMLELQKAPPAQEGLEAILLLVSVYLSRKDKNWTNTRTLLLLMTDALLEGSENVDQMVSFNLLMFQYLEHNIICGIAKGEIDKSVSPKVGAEFVVGVLRGMMLQRLVRGGDVKANALRKDLLNLVRRGLAVTGR